MFAHNTKPFQGGPAICKATPLKIRAKMMMADGTKPSIANSTPALTVQAALLDVANRNAPSPDDAVIKRLRSPITAAAL